MTRLHGTSSAGEAHKAEQGLRLTRDTLSLRSLQDALRWSRGDARAGVLLPAMVALEVRARGGFDEGESQLLLKLARVVARRGHIVDEQILQQMRIDRAISCISGEG